KTGEIVRAFRLLLRKVRPGSIRIPERRDRETTLQKTLERSLNVNQDVQEEELLKISPQRSRARQDSLQEFAQILQLLVEHTCARIQARSHRPSALHTTASRWSRSAASERC